MGPHFSAPLFKTGNNRRKERWAFLRAVQLGSLPFDLF